MPLPRDRVVLVTGASRGIGRAIALAFVRDGARVAALARTPIRDLDALCLEGDVRRPDDLRVAVSRTVGHFGALHILINSAGVGLYARVEDLAREDLEDLFASNLYGPISAIQAALPHLRRTRGQVINITSVVGHAALPLSGAYCMTKHALHAMGVALRIELASDGIDVLEIAPGVTRTEFVERAKVVGWNRAPRLGNARDEWTAERVAEAVLMASRKGTRERLLSLRGKALVWAQRMAPSLVDGMLRRLVRDALVSEPASNSGVPPTDARPDELTRDYSPRSGPGIR